MQQCSCLPHHGLIYDLSIHPSFVFYYLLFIISNEHSPQIPPRYHRSHRWISIPASTCPKSLSLKSAFPNFFFLPPSLSHPFSPTPQSASSCNNNHSSSFSHPNPRFPYTAFGSPLYKLIKMLREKNKTEKKFS